MAAWERLEGWNGILLIPLICPQIAAAHCGRTDKEGLADKGLRRSLWPHPLYFRFHQRQAAGRCAAIVVAGLKRDIGGGALSVIACTPQRIDLRVRHAGLWVEALSYHLQQCTS